jgi:hypothetical protein
LQHRLQVLGPQVYCLALQSAQTEGSAIRVEYWSRNEQHQETPNSSALPAAICRFDVYDG